MELNLDSAAVLDKTLELCQTIVGQADFQVAKGHVDVFMADDQARHQYQLVAEKGQQLHEKRHQGEMVTRAEIDDFETDRKALLSNPVASNFIAAQEQMQQVHDTVNRYVRKSLELGRVPSEEDFESCSPGCSCGH